jgi:hypothetical protein
LKKAAQKRLLGWACGAETARAGRFLLHALIAEAFHVFVEITLALETDARQRRLPCFGRPRGTTAAKRFLDSSAALSKKGGRTPLQEAAAL